MPNLNSDNEWLKAGLQALFAPSRIAVVGASPDPARIGGRPIRYARAAAFQGKIYPVNPKHAEIQGLRAYPDLGSIPEPIDLAIVAVPAAQVPATITAAANRGAKAAIIFSSGFAECGAEGAQRQAALRDLCRSLRVRVLGPNCLGIFNAAIGHTATFASFLQDATPAGGHIALVSQSGAYASYLYALAAKRGIGIGRWVTTGNEMDVDIADAIEYLVDDRSVSVIACVAEGIRNGRNLLRAIERAHDAAKPFVLLKMGRTADGMAAAKSHTAALAVDDIILDGVIGQAGGVRVATTQDLLDVLYGLQLGPPLSGRRLGILSVSGGAGVLMADAADEHGFEVVPLPAEVQQRLQVKLPYGTMTNPVDVTAQVLNDLALVDAPLRAMLTEGGYDAVVAFFMNWLESAVTGSQLRAVLSAALGGSSRCTLALAASGSIEMVREYERQGIAVLEDPARAIAMLGAMARTGELLRATRPAAPSLEEMPLAEAGPYSELRAKVLLARTGLAFLDEVLARDPCEAGVAVGAIAGPAVLKIVSVDLPHKSDYGGVRLHIEGRAAGEIAAAEMLTVVRQRCPHARIDGILVSPMLVGGIEMIVGAHVDTTFGSAVMVGFGGVLVEIMRDTQFRYGAIETDEAHRMIDQLRGRALLDGARGKEPADIDALAAAVSLVSRFGAANADRLQSVEINPLVVLGRGKGCVALDALLTVRQGSGK